MHDTPVNETNRMLTKEGKLDSAYGHTILSSVLKIECLQKRESSI